MFLKLYAKLTMVLMLTIVVQSVAFALEMKTMNLNRNQLYVLNFDDEIEIFNNDDKILDAQVMNTIFDDKKRLILKLKEDKPTVLQVKTKNHYYNYEIGFLQTEDKADNLTVIDAPPDKEENLPIDLPPGLGDQ